MRVLFVDDEPNILDSIRRQLRKSYDIVTATSGIEALALLKATGPVALVISDMRMPGMNGAELLTTIRDDYPETVRMILSGQADLESTIAAINDGHVFRFLTKPCHEEGLRRAVNAGLEQYGTDHHPQGTAGEDTAGPGENAHRHPRHHQSGGAAARADRCAFSRRVAQRFAEAADPDARLMPAGHPPAASGS